MEIQLFNSPQFGAIRTAGTPDSPLFCLADVCKILDLTPSKVAQRLDGDVLSKYTLQTNGGEQLMNFVNEDGLYDVILDSRKPEAKAFRKWITSEVIPSIRKKGVYASDNFIEQSIADPDYAIRMLTQLKEERERNKALAQENEQKQALLEEQKPKVLFADAVTASKQSCLIGELAKILKQNGVEIGQNRLFAWMRDKEYLGKTGEYYNIPTQRAMEMGLFELKKSSVVNPDGSNRTTITPKVTGKGQQYFINKFLGGAKKDTTFEIPNIEITDYLL